LKTGDPLKLIDWIKEYTYTPADEKKKTPEELAGKLKCAEFKRVSKPIYAGTNNRI
jgi:hypothetical protein